MKFASGFFRPWSRLSGGNYKPLLNLGCGSHFHPDWVNVDFAGCAEGVWRHDLRQPLPFPDASFKVVYHSHVLEHFSHAFAAVFLKECCRLLKAGGILRVVLPDLEMIARLYLKNLEGALLGNQEASDRHAWMTLELLDQLVREESGGEMGKYWMQNPMPAEDFVVQRTGWEVMKSLRANRSRPPERKKAPRSGRASPRKVVEFRESGEIHRWMYDRHSLQVLLEKVGFKGCRVCAANESRISGFNSYLLDINEDGSVRKPDSLFMEAVKISD